MAVTFSIRGESIALHQLLKASGLCSSGGAAKRAIELGQVQVDGKSELRKACSIRAGQTVTLGDQALLVQ